MDDDDDERQQGDERQNGVSSHAGGASVAMQLTGAGGVLEVRGSG